MSKIPCDTILDLIPLVRDNIASDSSVQLVKNHIQTCENCREVYEGLEILDDEVDDVVIISKIKRQFIYVIFIIILIGVFFGMLITNSIDMFYNSLIMPTIGGLSFIVLKRKSLYFPAILFLVTCVWQSLYLSFTEGFDFFIIIGSVFYGGIYALLGLIGIVIVWLLEYAFRKE